MAIFKNFTVVKNGIRYSAGETNTGLVVNPSDGDLWIDSQPYDADTLYPLFSKPCTALKNNKVYEAIEHGFVASAIVAKGPCLANGQDTGTAECGGLSTYRIGSRDLNLEDTQTLAMSSNLFRFTSTAGAKMNLLSIPYGTSVENAGNTSYSPVPLTQKYAFIEGDDFSNPSGSSLGKYQLVGFQRSGYEIESLCWPVYVDTANQYIYFVNYYPNNVQSVYYRTLSKGVSRALYTTIADNGALVLGDQNIILSPNDGSTWQHASHSEFEHNSFYYCGKNLDNTLMFLETVELHSLNYMQQDDNNGDRSDKIFNVESYDVSNSSVTTIATINTSSFTSSSVAVKYMLRARPSQFVMSPLLGQSSKFYAYYPVADANYEVSFALLTWDKTTNAGTMVADNCTMVYGSGVVTDYLQYPTKYTSGTGASDMRGRQIRSNTFITRISDTSYFLHYLPSYGSPTSVSAQPALAKTLVTYEIDIAGSDFSTLTYHSSVQVDACDFVHLNATRTKIAVIASGVLKVYTWNNGWVETASETGSFVGVCKDEKDRIIGISASANNSTATANSLDSNFSMINHKIHLIADSLPSTITVTFATSTLTYTGSDISTSIDVSTYDGSGTRIAKAVDLKIDGANAVFTTTSGTSTTETTSTSIEKNVLVTVTGPGPLTISASFTI